MSYKKEYCYLTDEGKQLVSRLIDKGLNEELALELAHIALENDELYELEESYEKRRDVR